MMDQQIGEKLRISPSLIETKSNIYIKRTDELLPHSIIELKKLSENIFHGSAMMISITLKKLNNL
jgi:hypothetical protein